MQSKTHTKPIQSVLSHDKKSDRIYLMYLNPDDFPHIIDYMEDLAEKHSYTKVFVKIPSKYGPAFIAAGYINEATIPGFFNDQQDVLFLVKYRSPARNIPEKKALIHFQKLLLTPVNAFIKPLESAYRLQPLSIIDAENMTTVFKTVFKTYPFPIFDPNFLIKSIQEDDTRYFGLFFNDKLVAISSAECNTSNLYAEMTDFAVLPEYRGKSLARHLLSFMEKGLANEQFKTLYTIARLHSIPMNAVFYHQGYQYAGTLTQNTQISGKIESMNVWYKKIS